MLVLQYFCSFDIPTRAIVTKTIYMNTLGNRSRFDSRLAPFVLDRSQMKADLLTLTGSNTAESLSDVTCLNSYRA